MDTLTPAARSALMSRIRSKDTKPEMEVRRLVHGLGFRYRLHDRDLPGHPDLVFASRGRIIFVHGCFWHRHETCKDARWPKSNLDFWKPKLEGNRLRDKANQKTLKRLGWKLLIIWECQLREDGKLAEKILRFMEDGR